MAVGITDLAHPLRKNSAESTAPISLSHGQQLVCAALGHKSLASFQAAQNDEQEPQTLDGVRHVVADYDLLVERAAELKLKHSPIELRKLMAMAFAERLPGTKLHSGYDDLAAAFHDLVQYAVFSDDRVNADGTTALLERVEVREASAPADRPEIDGQLYSQVVVTDANGNRIERTVTISRGDSRNPLTDAEVDAKFLACLGVAGWSTERATTLLTDLHALTDGGELQPVQATLNAKP